MSRARKPLPDGKPPERQGLDAARHKLKAPVKAGPMSLGRALGATAALVAAASFSVAGFAVGDPLNLT